MLLSRQLLEGLRKDLKNIGFKDQDFHELFAMKRKANQWMGDDEVDFIKYQKDSSGEETSPDEINKRVKHQRIRVFRPETLGNAENDESYAASFHATADSPTAKDVTRTLGHDDDYNDILTINRPKKASITLNDKHGRHLVHYAGGPQAEDMVNTFPMLDRGKGKVQVAKRILGHELGHHFNSAGWAPSLVHEFGASFGDRTLAKRLGHDYDPRATVLAFGSHVIAPVAQKISSFFGKKKLSKTEESKKEVNMRCKRNELTGIVACFVNEMSDTSEFDHGGVDTGLENLPDNLHKQKKGKQPLVRVKSEPDEVGLHKVV